MWKPNKYTFNYSEYFPLPSFYKLEPISQNNTRRQKKIIKLSSYNIIKGAVFEPKCGPIVADQVLSMKTNQNIELLSNPVLGLGD